MKKVKDKVLNFFFPNEKNVEKNKSDIMNLLFYSEFKELSTEESIEVFNSVREDFENKLRERLTKSTLEKTNINDYLNKYGNN